MGDIIERKIPRTCTECEYWGVDLKTLEDGICILSGTVIKTDGKQDEKRMNNCPIFKIRNVVSKKIGKEDNLMDKTWTRIFKNYIADFQAIDKLKADGIIDEDDVVKLKNKLLVDIICTFESEVTK